MRACRALLGLLVPIAAWTGCEKYTSGYDTNPLAPSDASAQKTFVGAQVAFMEFTEGFPNHLASIWAQQATGVGRQFSAFDSYTVTGQNFGGDWWLAYTAILANLRLVEQKAGPQRNISGAARIVEGLHMGTVAAVWGDVPYSEAAQPDLTTTPKYDPQLSVYAAVQNVLDAGIADIVASGVPFSQDVFSYNGIPHLWLKAAHTVKARYYMHVARSTGYDGAIMNQVIQEAGQGILAVDGSEDLKFTHGVTHQGDMNLWHSFLVYDRSGDVDASATFVIPMMRARAVDGKSNEEGRLAYYFNSEGNNFNCAPGGAYAVDQSYVLLRASETHLLLAEANARMGMQSEAIMELNLARRYANTAYGNASQDFVPTDFSSSAELLQTILNEEYLALMHTIEVFNFVRRINYQIAYRDTTGQTVVLKPTNGDQFPQRFLYSVDEFTANPNMPTQTVADLFKPTTANSP